MGLFEAPDEEVAFVPLGLEGEDADLRVLLEEKFLETGPRLEGALLVNIEGRGRFRLYLGPA